MELWEQSIGKLGRPKLIKPACPRKNRTGGLPQIDSLSDEVNRPKREAGLPKINLVSGTQDFSLFLALEGHVWACELLKREACENQDVTL